jgi:APA family basic amino acid/polyamine antiporter/amino acid efflux transporter
MAELNKTLGFWTISAIALLNLVNTGVFFGVSIGAQAAGIDSMLAWIALAVLSVYMAMCFGELTSMFPRAGGVYEFARQAYGRFTSFLIGWAVWISGNIATALFTVAAMDYLLPDIPLDLGGIVISAPVLKLLACIAILYLMNYIAYRGVDASARLMTIIAASMALVFGMIFFLGFSAVDPTNFTGFTLQGTIILLAMFFLSETFYGWESVSFMSEETKDAERVIPKALVTVASIVALAMIGIVIIVFGVLGANGAAGTDRPIIAVFTTLNVSPWVLLAINIGIALTLLGNASGNVVSLPRLLLALARDKLFIEQFSDIHPTRQTPHRAIMLQMIVGIIIIVIAQGLYMRLLELLVPVSLLLYASIAILVPWFRWRRPEQERPYKAPFGSWLPVIISVAFVCMLVAWAAMDPAMPGSFALQEPAVAVLRLLGSFLLFAVPIYLTLTYFYDPDSLIATIGVFARLNLALENVLVPRKLRRDVIEFFTNARGKQVLEFGSGVGTLTAHLAEHVGPGGKVVAVDLSKSNVEIVQRRMRKLGHNHVVAMHDPHLVNRIHPDIKNADIIVSINNLSYIQDVKKVLAEMNRVLPARGRICFIEYVDFFFFLPNPKWLSDSDQVRLAFREAGFTVTVKKRRGIFWNYLYIYGIKESKNTVYI